MSAMTRRRGSSSTDWFIILPSIAFTVLLAAPLLALLVRSLTAGAIRSALSPSALAALRLTVLSSSAALAIIILLGTPLAFALAWWEFRGRRALETLVDLPLVLPPSVAGLALLLAFGRQGLLGPEIAAFGISIPFTTLAVIMAQIFVSAPLYIRSARAGFAGLDQRIEEAALVEGASTWQLFSQVILPISRRAIASGAILALARAIGEFGATLIFAGNLPGVTQTMPLAIYVGFETSLSRAIALSVILVFVSIVLLWGLRRYERDED
jgi:molybdate transport system permease protein